MFLGGDAGERLEPVCKMRCTVVNGPVFHGLGDGIGDADVEAAPLVDRFSQ